MRFFFYNVAHDFLAALGNILQKIASINSLHKPKSKQKAAKKRKPDSYVLADMEVGSTYPDTLIV